MSLARASRVQTAAGSEAMGLAVSFVPPRVLDRVQGVPCLHEGSTATFAGLWRPEWKTESLTAWARYFPEGPAYRGDRRSPRQRSLISLYEPEGEETVGALLHEIGHFVYDRLLTRHTRLRYTVPAYDPHALDMRWTSGLVPPMISVSSYKSGNFKEQFAEAFRLWLSPVWALHGQERGSPLGLYKAGRPGERLTDWGTRYDNRHILAWLNELADWEPDRAPRALRESW